MASAKGPIVFPTPAANSEIGENNSPRVEIKGNGTEKKAWGGWGTPRSPPATNLADIMSEELASSLQVEEEDKFVKEELLDPVPIVPVDELSSLLAAAGVESNTSSDFMIAQMLQMQYSREYDDDLRKVQQKYNGHSKVSVTLDNYMMSPRVADDSDSEDDDLPIPKAWDSFEAYEKAFPQMPRCGYIKVNDSMVTKHDVTMNARRNACKVMESFPPCIETGDTGSFDMQLSNKVYNNLRAYSKKEDNRRSRLHDKKEKSTAEMALDPKTRLLLYKLCNVAVLDQIFGIISSGKEAVVLYASGGSGEIPTHPGKNNGSQVQPTKLDIPQECAIKVFKTTLNEFKTRDRYIKEDYRFKDRFSKQNPRKVIHLWAEKEMHNLNRIAKAGIPCPSVVLLKKHVLVLSFIGVEGRPAQKLKDVIFSEDDLLHSAYNQVVDMIIRLFRQCNLVHADLSEYNILWHENKCYVIDVSQSVEPNHPNALEFLYRDCCNITHFFSKRGVKNCHTPESLFKDVTGYPLEATGEAEIINQIQDFEKNLELLTFEKTEKPFAFEYCWEKVSKSPPS